ncbi:hypothetical protein J4N45_00290 [Vibrio sp. SCSIO 43140]|uniref:hypothetical protein n=1 Tax=Vibrio sp. SCSIO 43140 TaxID=2819100 RepID=UPI002074E31D|nr:hypothetical protein [Vibrio sp. SCSIO 43140]USD60515.1 hypothetical protein J4N45_00290 [Vibrio sp. SCSIO 43140]
MTVSVGKKRLCKLNRRDISDNLGAIHSLVAEPKFLCRSCSRSSADKSTLCKPAAIPPASCQSKPLSEQQQCGVLAEALPITTTPKLSKAANKAESQPANNVEMSDAFNLDAIDKKSLKRAKKALKAQKKAQKKLRKVLKKSQKLLRKQSKLEHKYQLAAATVEKQVMKVQPEQLH